MRSSFCLLERQRRTTIKPIRAVLRRSPDPIVRLADASRKREVGVGSIGDGQVLVNRRGTAPSCKSTRSRLRIPMPTRLHHAVEYDQQLAHAGDQCNFLGLADRNGVSGRRPGLQGCSEWLPVVPCKAPPSPATGRPIQASASHNPLSRLMGPLHEGGYPACGPVCPAPANMPGGN